jgi:5-phospho-D-xylono-1,4-lactonase
LTAFARTVLGDINVVKLGVTNAHEHLAIRNGLIVLQHPEYRLDDADRAVREVTDFKDAGGQTIVEASPCGVGRDPRTLLKVSLETGVHVIASTGFHKESYYLDSHWRFRYSPEQIAALWQAEIEEGMEVSSYEGPLIERSEARAGIIKIATDYQNISVHARRAIEAAGIAHQATGAPILTHSEVGTMMLDQVRLLEKHGVKPNHVIVSHADRNPDWFVHRDVAQTGAFLEYDCPGRIKYFPESTIVTLLRRMFDSSIGSQILLGGDNARRSYWKAYGGGPGLAYINSVFIPRLRREGFSDSEIQQLQVANASGALAFHAPQDGRT